MALSTFTFWGEQVLSSSIKETLLSWQGRFLGKNWREFPKAAPLCAYFGHME